PEFTCDYEPDFRQKIADSWPSSIDDWETCEDWGWKMNYNLQMMAEDMIVHIREQQAQELVK
ncbi:MAG: NAD-dependent epimerase, partial [Bacteroidetes bacterium]|nr:NAD-dependent epimerase [Bacteroidota bacterium]